jgi:uncharacterized membrane protein YkvA (DUF1232 family)
MRFFIDGYRRLLTHPRYGIWVLLASLLYLVSPIDLSPDILPLLGQIDDVALIVLLVSAASQWLSQQFLQAEGTDPVSEAQVDPRDVQQTIDVDAIEVDSSEV